LDVPLETFLAGPAHAATFAANHEPFVTQHLTFPCRRRHIRSGQLRRNRRPDARVLDDEAIPERLMARYPPAEITAAQFEQFAVELLTAGQSGQPELEDFRVQTLERIEGVGGSYIFDATVRFRLFGMDFLIVVEAKNHTHPIKRELVQILHSTTAVSRPRTGQASEPPDPAPEQRQRYERTSQRADSEQGARERFRHRTAPISHECIGERLSEYAR
jgi:hypothetical protein